MTGGGGGRDADGPHSLQMHWLPLSSTTATDRDGRSSLVVTMSNVQMQDVGDLKDTNFPMDPEGRTHHVGVKGGEVANLIVSVGSHTRAELIARTFLESIEMERASTRGYIVFTGTYRSKRISVVGIGMGSPMMDFFVREVRHVVDGPIAIIRLGTCGNLGLPEQLPTASLAVSDKVLYISRDPDTVSYKFSGFALADPQLRSLVMRNMPQGQAFEVSSASADTFYSSQGRKETDFVDNNEHLLSDLRSRHPEVLSCEMEHFWLLHLAACSKPGRKVYAAVCAIVVGQRVANQMVTREREHEAERMSGKAVLDALADFSFPSA